MSNSLIKIGVFYDGGFFWHVSNYYNFVHPRHTRLSISGLHEYIRHQAAQFEGVETRYCHIVDAHYFRGRYSAYEAQNRNKLLTDRLFEDVLMKESIVTHFLPFGNRGEKGIDVWFALECYELALNKKFDIVVLVASDGDYIPLVRKLNTMGVRVMLLAWDFEFEDQNGMYQKTATSIGLIEECTYPIMMHNVIDDKTKRHDSIINGLFLNESTSTYRGPANRDFNQREYSPREYASREYQTAPPTPPQVYDDEVRVSEIVQLYDKGYGFIATEDPHRHLFFHYSELLNCDFQDLAVGDQVEYKLGYNDRGECAVEIRKMDYEQVPGDGQEASEDVGQ